MIIVELMGGLGNQMFQYAAARTLALRYDVPCAFDTTYLLDRTPQPDFVFRDYDLGIWNIAERFAAPHEIARLKPAATTLPSRLQRLLRSTGLQKTPPVYYYQEAHFHYDTHFEQLKPPVYLHGYWQSEKYFADIADVIRRDFTFKTPLSENCRELARQIDTSTAVCINVRRGDFVNILKANQHHGFVGTDYLLPAVASMAQTCPDATFFVFSDDIAWCRANIRIEFPTVFVGHEYAGTQFRDYLELMIRCRHFIIPNSTFAWWAAWLSPHPDKRVIAPRRWFANPALNDSDIVPAAWERL